MFANSSKYRNEGIAMGLNAPFIQFKGNAYMDKLKKELRLAMKEIERTVYKDIRANLESIPFSDVNTHLDSGMTSDLDRKQAVMDSIKTNLKYAENDLLVLTVDAMAENFKESFIGFYYEYGTGENFTGQRLNGFYSTNETIGEREPSPFVTPTPNPMRSGPSIVTRDKSVDSGLGAGRYLDMGGNVHITHCSIAGEEVPYGYVVKAYHWFSNALEKNAIFIQKTLSEAVASVNISDFFIVADEFILGAQHGNKGSIKPRK